MGKGSAMTVYHAQVTGKDCIGCKNSNRDIVVSVSTDDEDYDIVDLFFTDTQAIELANKLLKTVKINSEKE